MYQKCFYPEPVPELEPEPGQSWTGSTTLVVKLFFIEGGGGGVAAFTVPKITNIKNSVCLCSPFASKKLFCFFLAGEWKGRGRRRTGERGGGGRRR